MQNGVSDCFVVWWELSIVELSSAGLGFLNDDFIFQHAVRHCVKIHLELLIGLLLFTCSTGSHLFNFLIQLSKLLLFLSLHFLSLSGSLLLLSSLLFSGGLAITLGLGTLVFVEGLQLVEDS